MVADAPATPRRVLPAAGVITAITASTAASAWLVGRAVAALAGDRNAPWLLGRAAGITSYLLLVALVAFGLLLSHPAATRLRGPGPAMRLRIHVTLAAFTLVFTALHVVVLATDRFAGVGWGGSIVPGLSGYRPLPVALGVLAAYAGLLAGVTAAGAGRFAGRVWWPIHKVAGVSLALVWCHGLLAGSDTPALTALYVLTGAGLLALAASRYTARNRADMLHDGQKRLESTEASR